jgi:hypothetical protein
MSDTVKFSCVINNTNPVSKLGLEIWLNQENIFDQTHITEPILFEHDINDDDCEYELKFVMKGKLPEHTKINENADIISDSRLSITEVKFDKIALGHKFSELAVYSHDFNGTADLVEEKFYGEMGCNGTLCLKFTTPLYFWLLENM